MSERSNKRLNRPGADLRLAKLRARFRRLGRVRVPLVFAAFTIGLVVMGALAVGHAMLEVFESPRTECAASRQFSAPSNQAQDRRVLVSSVRERQPPRREVQDDPVQADQVQVRHVPVRRSVPVVYDGFQYRNCDAARAAGAAPVRRGEPGYGPHLDRDNDDIGCEPYRGR